MTEPIIVRYDAKTSLFREKAEPCDRHDYLLPDESCTCGTERTFQISDERKKVWVEVKGAPKSIGIYFCWVKWDDESELQEIVTVWEGKNKLWYTIDNNTFGADVITSHLEPQEHPSQISEEEIEKIEKEFYDLVTCDLRDGNLNFHNVHGDIRPITVFEWFKNKFKEANTKHGYSEEDMRKINKNWIDRLEKGRDYLMQVDFREIVVEDCLEAFEFRRDGLPDINDYPSTIPKSLSLTFTDGQQYTVSEREGRLFIGNIEVMEVKE